MAGQSNPTRFVVARMKLKFAGWAVHAAENPEQVEGFQFDAFQSAVMCSSHTSSTVDFLKKRLQNGGGFVA